jgi:hypothetical protein
VKATAARNPSVNSTARESKSDRPRPSSTVSASPHGNEKQKRNNGHPPGPVNPPTPSLGPALRLPAQ